MIQVVDNFNYRGKKPNFDRDSFDTLYDMKNYSENSLDDGHISYCKETDKHYKFNSNNQSDPTTGKWVEQHEAVPADEEDITEQNGTLQLANKTYDKQSFSGLGRVYLRKNIVGDKNVLTQAMINKANTIYVIQYDYDLKEASINIPENCVLQFDGGSLSNGNITLNNTIVSQPKIDNNNVKIIGNMLNTDRDKINAIYYWIKNKNITFRHNLFYGTNGFDNNYNKLKTLGINEFQVFFSLNNSKELGFKTDDSTIIYGIDNIVNYFKDKHVDVRSIKFHSYPIDSYNEIKQHVENIISSNIFPFIESVFVVNENQSVFSSNTNIDNYVSIVNELSKKYTNIDFGIISSDFIGIRLSKGYALTALNDKGVFAINYYPKMGNNEDPYDDNIIDNFKYNISNHFGNYSKLCRFLNVSLDNKIYITETGCNDYEDGGFTGGNNSTIKGNINSINAIRYMNCLLDNLNLKNIVAIYGWRCHQWDDKTISLAINNFSKLNKI